MDLLQLVVYVAGGLLLSLFGLLGYLLSQKDQNNKANFDELYDKIEGLTSKFDVKYEGFVRATTTGFNELKDVMNDLSNKTMLDRDKLKSYNENCERMTDMVTKRLDSHEKQIRSIRKILADHDIYIKTKINKDEK
jgi:hypothetical protein